ncbi:unnamed protein product [Arabidopsis lyrata]|uniref:Peptidase A1 domain-containing protein n=1 Tax=Arabidopsis lyrata subsp. lyrata TaxID=81972 RepID=D7MI19_ARALL|nr:hypothetical protein ARALYDRAFT_915767 [Arabidopsis lyrata subsp. lyrata]CAH8277181.1 unnamed protein product [Arabidopsis lyrata]
MVCGYEGMVIPLKRMIHLSHELDLTQLGAFDSSRHERCYSLLSTELSTSLLKETLIDFSQRRILLFVMFLDLIPSLNLLPKDLFLLLLFCFHHRLYYTTLQIRKPPREFNVVIDTGSNVLWVSCISCVGCPLQNVTFFDPGASSAAVKLACSDKRFFSDLLKKLVITS